MKKLLKLLARIKRFNGLSEGNQHRLQLDLMNIVYDLEDLQAIARNKKFEIYSELIDLCNSVIDLEHNMDESFFFHIERVEKLIKEVA
jgi:hypothetical protein